MPFEITFSDLPAGYLAESVTEGQQAIVTVREFTSSEDGDLFITRLDGIPSQIIGMLPAEGRIKSSIVDHMLAVIRRDKTASVYVNELTVMTDVRIKGRDLKAGDPVYGDDIADIRRVRFPGVQIPPDCGVVYVFSHGWRKGLFFDFRPLSSVEPELRNYDLEVLLAQYYSYLSFQDLFKITEEGWIQLFEQKWFPFVSLKRATIKDMLSFAANEWNIDNLTERIATEVSELLPGLLSKWSKMDVFQPHFPLFQQAAERFVAKDYISATAILYPRIEGLMRTHYLHVESTDQATQGVLVNSVIQARAAERHALSLLLPANFRKYLQDVYFAGFDPRSPDILSRHSVSHGVAPAELFSMKGATIGLLLLDQLSFYIGTEESADSSDNGDAT